MAEKTGTQIPCPICGEPLNPKATKCENCGASVPKPARDSLADLMKSLKVDAEQAQKLYNLGYRNAEELKDRDLSKVLQEEPKIFLCPECGAFVHEKDEKCTRCGAEFAGEAVEIEDFLLREERPCPHCGEPVHTDAASCPACGKPITEVKGVSLGSTYMCPSCGVTVLEGQKECEVCGQELTPAALIASKALELEGKACPKCGGTLDPETGLCPYCTGMEEAEEVVAEGEAEEVMEEIDKFLEHLATTKPAKKKPGERIPASPDMFRVSPTKAKQPPVKLIEKSIEKPKEEEIEVSPERAEIEAELEALPLEQIDEATVEKTAEVALGGLEAEVKSLPKVKVLKSSFSKLPKKVPAAREIVESETIGRTAEGLLYATAIGLSLQFFASRIGEVILDWALFLLFGTAWGLSMGIIALSSRNLRKGLVLHWQQIIGTMIILIVPIHWYAGSAWPMTFDIILVLAGLAFWIPAIVKMRGKDRWIIVWAGGSAVATALMPATVLSINIGGDAIAWSLWTASAILILTGVVLSIHVRWIRWEIDHSLRLGEDEFRRQEFQKSVEDYDRAIRLSRIAGEGNFATPWYSKGAALVVLGRYEEALKAIDEALKINPNNEIAWVNKGNALSRMGDYKEALKAFNAALRANPRYEVAWNNKGNSLARLGRYRESLKCYDLALEVDPNYKGAWINKGFVLAKVGEFEEAAKCAERAMLLSSSPIV